MCSFAGDLVSVNELALDSDARKIANDRSSSLLDRCTPPAKIQPDTNRDENACDERQDEKIEDVGHSASRSNLGRRGRRHIRSWSDGCSLALRDRAASGFRQRQGRSKSDADGRRTEG